MPYFNEDNVIASVAILSGDIPLKIISTQLITNLNAEFLNGHDSDYFLDAGNLIGTLSPLLFDDSVHGNRSGGSLHTTATTTINGFMSASDKVKLDQLTPGVTNVQNVYSSISDGTNTSYANSVTDTIRFRTNNTNYLTIVVNNDDPSYGDNILFSIDFDQIEDDLKNALSIDNFIITGTATLTKNTKYYVDTRLSEFNVNISNTPTPQIGDTIWIIDLYNYFSSNSLTLNSNLFFGVIDTVELNIPREYKLTYINDTFGWKIT